ncbi:hypothetical protein D9758_009424 [Tetrapyrgos nigripes]|uniref:F-box domain-containing protein n=1 Tax=Tetrapyrgos nigripes TaxID=182062 RepID=A0A8H5FWR1_9AGAR|nr:hypothetical protein D9758_009424 [Tetrapyrgos nigripes]
MTSEIHLCDQCGHTLHPDIRFTKFSSDTSTQLRSFFWPPNNDGTDVYREIDGIDNEIQKFNEEIERLRGSFSLLENARDGLVRLKAGRSALYSPIRKIPIETLELIFSFCSRLPELDHSQTISQHCREPKQVAFVSLPILSVAQTCALWREICLRKPEFWTDLVFRFDALYQTTPYTNTLRESSLTPLVTQYLSYSKSSPITIDFHAFGPRQTESDSSFGVPDFHEFVIGLLSILLAEAERWRSVVLALDYKLFHLDNFPQNGPIHMLANSQSGAVVFPHLENLSVIVAQENMSQHVRWEPHFARCVSTAPISQLMIPSCRGLDLPADRLTVLTFQDFEFSSIRILKHCQNLQRLQILSYHSGSDSLNQSTSYSFPHLSHFEISLIGCDEEPNAPDLFKVLALPSLATLIVKGEADDDGASPQWDMDAFSTMMSCSRDSLKTLNLYDVEMTSADVVEILSLTPHLTHFTCHLDGPMGIANDDEETDCPMFTVLDNLRVASDHDALEGGSTDLLPIARAIALLKHLVHLDLSNTWYAVDNATLKAACDVLESRFDSRDCMDLEYFRLITCRLHGVGERNLGRFNDLASRPGCRYTIVNSA